MLAGISTFCFAASYLVALLLEITRLWFRSGIRSAVLLAFAIAGWFAHTSYLGYQAYLAVQQGRPPLSSSAEFFLLGAWLLIGLYLYLTLSLSRVPSGIFVLPVVLLLIAAGSMASNTPFAATSAVQIWGQMHGIFLLLGYVIVALGFVVGIMYFLQAKRLKQKKNPSSRFRLPALEWLERANHRATLWAALFVGIGCLSGIILKLIQPGSFPWTDPVVWRSAAMWLWLVVAAIFASYYAPAQRGRKVAYLTVASFVFLVTTVTIGLLLESGHKNTTTTTPTTVTQLAEVPSCS